MGGGSTQSRGLLVDDDALYLRTLQRSLARRGLEVAVALDGEQALAAARRDPPEFALVDLRIGAGSGLDLIAPLKAIRADMKILLVTGYASVATAVEAIKRGADNYLLKPVTVDAILRALGDDAAARDEPEPESTMIPLSRLEWEHIQQALNETDGNISAAARLLGMHRRSLQRKLAKRPGPERRAPDDLE
jgi:two-component system response regulator RegA